MTDLQQAIRDSAEALGKVIHTQPIVRETGVSTGRTYIKTGEQLYEEWNPPGNAERDRLLRDWLIQNGFGWEFQGQWTLLNMRMNPSCAVVVASFNCPPNEFLTRAVSAVWKESEK